jgi:hypothetical protein
MSANSPVLVKKKRPYFVWDYDYDEDDIRAMLYGDNEYQRAWAISRILSHVAYPEIWRYVTVPMIRRDWERLALWPPERKELWRRALDIWTREEKPAMYERPLLRTSLADKTKQPHEILTPFQLKFLEGFFSSPLAQSFFLTGGTALAAYHLGHRLSIDIDLFTLKQEDFERMPNELRAIAAQAGWTLRETVNGLTFKQYIVSVANEPPLKVDLVRDAGQVFGEQLVVNGVRVDALDNIAVNKVTAIFGRAAAKDFVDLYFILQAGYTMEQLLPLAKEKDLGLTEFYLGNMMAQVQRITELPTMLNPVSLEEIKAYFTRLAEQLTANALS